MAVKVNKKTKAGIARKNAEAMKAKKKSLRMSNSVGSSAPKPGSKGKSIVGQSKKKK